MDRRQARTLGSTVSDFVVFVKILNSQILKRSGLAFEIENFLPYLCFSALRYSDIPQSGPPLAHAHLGYLGIFENLLFMFFELTIVHTYRIEYLYFLKTSEASKQV